MSKKEKNPKKYWLIPLYILSIPVFIFMAYIMFKRPVYAMLHPWKDPGMFYSCIVYFIVLFLILWKTLKSD